MELKPFTLDDIVRLLLSGEPWAWSRWGDGEWSAILRRVNAGQSNCDGHHYFPDLCAALKRVLLSHPKYILGMQNFALRLYPRIESWLKLESLLMLDWRPADVLHHASEAGKMHLLTSALSGRETWLVGPDRLAPLLKKFGWAGHVGVPLKDCYLRLPAIIQACQREFDRRLSKRPVVLVSCGPPAKLLIDRLQADYLAEGFTFIDCGSVWDPYVGVVSRRYHKTVIEHLNKNK